MAQLITLKLLTSNDWTTKENFTVENRNSQIMHRKTGAALKTQDNVENIGNIDGR